MQFYSTGFSTQGVDAVMNGEVNCKFDSAKFTLCVGDMPGLGVHDTRTALAWWIYEIEVLCCTNLLVHILISCSDVPGSVSVIL